MVFSLLAFVCFMIISTCIRCFQHNRVRVGVDFGPKLIGVAQVNYLGKVRSVKVITNPGNFSTISREIVGIAERLSACEIILGVNLDRSGLLGYDNVTNKNGRTCLDFSKVLCCWANRLTSGKVKVKLYDERFSTKEAQFKTNAISSKGLDSIAAVCILERYLEEEGESAINAIPCPFPPPYALEIMHRSVLQNFMRYREEC